MPGGSAALDQVTRVEPEPLGPVATPVIHAINRNRQPVRLEQQVVAHQYWQWDFGDGNLHGDMAPGNVRVELEHTYARPGISAMTAVSWSAQGTELATWKWRVQVEPRKVGQPHAFVATTVAPPEVQLKLEGPLAWVTGRAADYSLNSEIGSPPGSMTTAQIASIYPGSHFQTTWERPGTFLVNGAPALRLTYQDGTGARSVTNVYTVEQPVRVYATVMTD